MKIKFVIPAADPDFFKELLKNRECMATDEISVSVVQAKHGAASVESAYDVVMSAPSLVEEAIKAEKDGFDAIIIDCAADPAVRAIREMVSIPVVAAAESSYLMAMAVCSKFSIVAVLDQTVQLIEENIRKYGISSRVASVRVANIPVLSLKDEQAAIDAICRAGKLAIEEDCAQAIVLGCTGMKGLKDKVEEILQVPVLEPLSCAFQLAASMVRMNLAHSKKAYPKPADKKVF